MKRLLILLSLFLLLSGTASAEIDFQFLNSQIRYNSTFREAYAALIPYLGAPDIISVPSYVDEWTMDPYPSELVSYAYVVWLEQGCFYELSVETWIEIQREGNAFSGYEYSTRDPLRQHVNFNQFPSKELTTRYKLYQ